MVEVNLSKNKYNIKLNQNSVAEINDKVVEYEFSHIIGDNYNLRIANKNYNFILSNVEEGKVDLVFDGNSIQASVKSELDLLLEKMGFDASASKKVSNIKSPMPGLILDIVVKKGQEVKEGETILVLEAMKMENIIKSPCDGVIKNILVNNGDSLEKGAILIDFS